MISAIAQFDLLKKLLLPALSLCLIVGCGGIVHPDPDVLWIAFGDSTTNGPTDENYWKILCEQTGQPLSIVTNEGHGGETSDEGLERLAEILDLNIYPNAEVLLYWEGGNDIQNFIRNNDPLLILSPESPDYVYKTQWLAKLDEIQANIESAIQLGKDNGLTVYVATYYPIKPNIECGLTVLNVLTQSQADIGNEYGGQLNARIRLAASNKNAILVDIELRADEILANPANYYNCNHLSGAGNTIVADQFYDVMTN